MIYITPSQATTQLVSLFDPHAPAGLRCFSVLAGPDTGTILTGDPNRPTWAAVWEAGDGTLYFGGAPDESIVGQVVATLRHDGDVLVGFWDGDPLANLLPPDPDYIGSVIEFLDRPADGAGLEAFRGRLPEGHTIRYGDRALLERCLWYDDTVRRHGSAEAFLEKGRVVCLMHDDDILCEAYAGPLVMGVRELGVITHEQYRGRGLATITCAHLIYVCEQSGERTYWNCAAMNVASAAVARKLGYQTEKEYQLRAWFKSGA
jgi:GNAT superfamily N-acetyltransferase